MAKPSKKPEPEEIETETDAWERFEKTIGKIVPPKSHKGQSQTGAPAYMWYGL